MNRSDELTEVAGLIGRAIEAGAMQGPAAASFGPLLAEAGVAEAVVPLLFAEACHADPDMTVLDGYAFMLRSALEELRISANSGDPSAQREIERARAAVAAALNGPPVNGGVLVQVGRCFAQAQLDPGEALQTAVAERIEAIDTDEVRASSVDATDHYAGLVEELEHDPFAIHADLAATAAAFPVSHRARVIGGFAASPHPAMREAAVGFAMAAEPEVAAALVSALSAMPEGSLSAGMAQRLRRMRAWLPASRRARIDAMLDRCSEPAGPVPSKGQVRAAVATLSDGAGAQSLGLAVKRGREHDFVSVLLKGETGVFDVIVRRDVGKRNLDALMRQLQAGAGAVEVSTGYIERRLSAALAVNVARAVPPPFALVLAVEVAGLGPLEPQAVGPAGLVDPLLGTLPSDLTGSNARREAHRASADWEWRFDSVSSWFEAGEHVERLLAPLKTKAQRSKAVLDRLLPARRQFWAEQCAWAAATVHEITQPADPTWIEFALVARDLAGDVPLDQIPFMRHVARRTVEAFGR